jgi:hypothetical protein
MSSDDDDREIGEALRQAFIDLVPDFEPSDQLRSNVSAMGSQRSRRNGHKWRSHRRLTAGLAAAISFGAVSLLAFGPSAVSESFAVTVEANRSVRVTLYELSGAEGANARLKALGVNARIVPIRSSCPTRVALTYLGISERPAPTVRLFPRKIPVGMIVVLAAQRVGNNHVELAFGRVTGEPPTCVRPGEGPGLKLIHR